MKPPRAGPAIDCREPPADQSLVVAAVARRDDAPDDREREREEPAGAEALDGAEDDQLRHPPLGAAESRPEEEELSGVDKIRTPPVDYADVTDNRAGSGCAVVELGE